MDIETPGPLPALPKLPGEIILDVFTHRSLRFPGAPMNENSEYGDNGRLAVLGEKVLEAAVTDTLFRKRPMLKGHELEVRWSAITLNPAPDCAIIPQKRRKDKLSTKNIERWITGYKMREKLRCSADAVPNLQNPEVRHGPFFPILLYLTIFNVVQEISLLFNSYVGAVYATQGMPVVQNWIGALVDPDYVSAPQPDVDMDPPHNPKKFKPEQFSPVLSGTPEPMMSPPPPPAGPPPPLPAQPNPLTPAQPNTAFLPLFNQTANQRRMFVEYPAQFSGPAHAGKWTVKCVGEQIQDELVVF